MTAKRKAAVQIMFMLMGAVFILYGMMRGEVGIVLSKAIKICLERVGIGYEKPSSLPVPRLLPGLATSSSRTADQPSYYQLFQRKYLPRHGESGLRTRPQLLFLSRCDRCLSHRLLSGRGGLIKVSLLLLHHRHPNPAGCAFGAIHLRFPLSLWMVSGAAAQNSHKKVFDEISQAASLFQICSPADHGSPSTSTGDQ